MVICAACDCSFERTSSRDKWCPTCRPKEHQRQRNEQKERARRAAGVPARLHDAHVRLWAIVRLMRDKVLHDAHVKEWKRDSIQYRWRYQNDEEFRIAECLRRQLRKKADIERIEAAVRASIHNDAPGVAVERLLGYSMADLKRHLERQFRGGMNWRTYGRNGWHIDHIKPKRCFDLTRVDEVRAFWALPNLRPLPAKENLKKNQHVYHLL